MLIIAHLTDLHFLQEDAYASLMKEVPLHHSPTFSLRAALKALAAEKPEVYVFSGDLVHEGGEKVYRALRTLINEEAGGAEIVAVPGNHDDKEAFFHGFLERETPEAFADVRLVNGYRFLSLDTTRFGTADGTLSQDQQVWLRNQLKQAAPKGTILVAHHPMESVMRWYRVDFREWLLSLLEESDVFLYLAGHTHYGEVRKIGALLQCTGESLAFGVEQRAEAVAYTETRGYGICRVEETVSYHHAPLVPYGQTLRLFASPEESTRWSNRASSKGEMNE